MSPSFGNTWDNMGFKPLRQYLNLGGFLELNRELISENVIVVFLAQIRIIVESKQEHSHYF